MATQIAVRRDTTANWTLANPVLGDGEPAYDTDTDLLRIGDGVTRFLSLPTTEGAATDPIMASVAADPTSQFARLQADLVAASLPVRYVGEFGAEPSTTADQAPSIQLALNSVSPGSTLIVPAGDYKVDSTLTIGKSIRLEGPGHLIAAHAGAGITVEADDVIIDGGLRLTGLQRAAWMPNERGITCTGAVGAPRRRLHIGAVTLTNFGGGAVVVENTEDFTSTDTVISASTYYGVCMLSVVRANLLRPRVTDINTGGLPNSYGITATRLNGTLAERPRSSDVTITEAVVTDVPDWAGIDTHAGQRIYAIRCIVTRCKRGIDFVAGTNEAGVIAFAPLDVKIKDCIVDGTSINTSHGIGMSGADSAPGTVLEYATGDVSGNHVIRCGDPTNNSLGGYWFRATLGLRHSNNKATEPGSHGVCFSQNNQAFQVSDFIAIDPWSDTHAIPSVISTRSTHCTGIVNSFYGRRGSKVATNVLLWGLYQSDATTATTVQLSPNCAIEGPGSLVAEGSSGLRTATTLTASMVTVGRGNGRLGFFQATPIAKPTGTPVAATDAATTQALVNDLRAKLISLGLMA